MKTTEFVNLTPHDVNVCLENGLKKSISFPRTVNIARVVQSTTQVDTLYFPVNRDDNIGIPVYKVEYGMVAGLPEPKDGVVNIVSAMVKNAVPERTDLVSPGEPLRDQGGNIVGCKGFFN